MCGISNTFYYNDTQDNAKTSKLITSYNNIHISC